MHQMELLHTELLRCCGRLALESGLFPQAFEMLSKALDREPTDPNILLMLSRAYLESSDSASVIRILVNAINTGISTIASDSRVWTMLALCYDQLDGFEDSLHAISQALVLESYYSVDPDLHLMQCRFFLKQGIQHYPLEVLLPYFDKMLESVKISTGSPNIQVEGLVSRAQLLYKYSEFEKALVDLDAAIAILNSKPESFTVGERLSKISYTYLLASTLRFLTNRPKDSLRLIEGAIFSYPHTAKSAQPLILANAMMNSVMEKDLTHTLHKMVLEEPHSAKGTSFLMNYIIARILLQLDPVHNVYDAYTHYQRALNLNIYKPYTWISIGSLYLRLGQVNDALSAYTQGSVSALESSQVVQRHGGNTAVDSKFSTDFNDLFGALAWFGIAQTYIFSRDLANAVEALLRSAQLFSKANNPQQVDELQRQIQTLSIYLSNPVNIDTVNIEYTIPDVPLQLILDLLLSHDSEVFMVKNRIEKTQQKSVSRITTPYTITPNFSPVNNSLVEVEDSSNNSNNNPLDSTKFKVEKGKSTLNTGSNTSFSSSNRSPILNGSSSLRTSTTTATTVIATPTPATSEVNNNSVSSTESPLLVQNKQILAPLLPKNSLAHQYSECRIPESTNHQLLHLANPQVNSINAYYPQMIPNIGGTFYQASRGSVPMIYQDVLTQPRHMGTYLHF